MVMYYLGMKYLVHPIIRWQDRLDEKARAKAARKRVGDAMGIADPERLAFTFGVKHGESLGATRNDAEWRAWYQRFLEHQARGELFEEPPPPPPHRNGSQEPEE